MDNLILVDTHVHYYPFCSFSIYFDSAYKNMHDAAEKIGGSGKFTAILCLLETETSHWYQDLLAIASSSKLIGDWQLEVLDNDQMLKINGGAGRELLIIPGQQIITDENLELLIIGSTHNISYRKPVHSYLQKYSDTYLVIIPWGVGKWLGARGRIVSNLIQKNPEHRFALGDNSGRPSVWKYVPQFNQARQKGINILPGSDPLPVEGQYKKVACYGSVVTTQLNMRGLAKQLRDTLVNSEKGSIHKYGHQDNLIRFIMSQLLLRFKRVKISKTLNSRTL